MLLLPCPVCRRSHISGLCDAPSELNDVFGQLCHTVLLYLSLAHHCEGASVVCLSVSLLMAGDLSA